MTKSIIMKSKHAAIKQRSDISKIMMRMTSTNRMAMMISDIIKHQSVGITVGEDEIIGVSGEEDMAENEGDSEEEEDGRLEEVVMAVEKGEVATVRMVDHVVTETSEDLDDHGLRSRNLDEVRRGACIDAMFVEYHASEFQENKGCSNRQ
mmetsp:Transcript_44632/g.71428  ORF Transcript_44632/g.71428 Transcript_44632/m.71428 type:complete len:150 (+) Transcript_44632:90-539(+)